LSNAEIAAYGRTPKVTYWEIGNEPPNSVRTMPGISLSEYMTRYKAITAAMLAQDPTIKVGACGYQAGGSGNMTTFLSDPSIKVDFLIPHWYGPVRSTTAPEIETDLKSLHSYFTSKRDFFVDVLQNTNRPTNTPLIISEWNPTGYENVGTPIGNSMTQALSVAEECFAFADLQLGGATYWDMPGYNGLKLPTYKMFQMLQAHMGDTLVFSDSPTEATRLYVTKDSATGEYALWGLNFSDSADAALNLNLDGLGFRTTEGTLSTLGWTPSYVSQYGPTGLLNPIDSGNTVYIDWTNTPATGLDFSNLSLLLPHSQVLCLVFAVPEPSSFVLLLAVIVSGATYRGSRRREAQPDVKHRVDSITATAERTKAF
jgi:hypothetical protein